MFDPFQSIWEMLILPIRSFCKAFRFYDVHVSLHCGNLYNFIV